MPSCTQASIGGELCDSVRDEYVQMKASWFAPEEMTTGFLFFSAGYLGTWANATAGDIQPSYYWPTSQTLAPAPSCTVGCGRCAVTGGTVDVLYWPSTEGPQPTGAVTLETLGTTLTYPTNYISYSNLYASNGCSGVGSTITSTIVAIPTDSALSSVYAGTVACDAHFRMTQVWTDSASFNIGDLQSSVPYSIYSSQPWCQSYLRDQGCQGTCPTTAPYKPIVVVPRDVLQALQPEWADCFGDIRGAYDPPLALQAVAAPAGPTMPGQTADSPEPTRQGEPASPADGPGPTTPTPTNAARPDRTPVPDAQAVQDPSRGGNDNDDAAEPTQNAGGAIASIIGQGGNSQEQRPAEDSNAGGVIASIIGNNAAAGGMDSDDDGDEPPNDPPNPSDSSVGAGNSNTGGSSNGASGNGASGNGASGNDGFGNDGSGNDGSGNGGTSGGTSGGDRGDDAVGNSASTDDDSSNAENAASPEADAGGPLPGGTTATIGSDVLTIVPAEVSGAPSAVQIAQGTNTAIVAPGSIATVGGNQVSFDNNGNIAYGSGSEQTMIEVPQRESGSDLNTALSIGSESVTLAPAPGSSSAIVVAYDGTTSTLRSGGVVSIGGVEASAGSDGGLVYGTGSDRTTVDMPTQRASSGAAGATTAADGSSEATGTSPPQQADGNTAGQVSSSLLFAAVASLIVLYVSS